ncbi:glutathione peroxidase [Wenyingzhuangia sp. 2_MG-2023]|uniref:glutathione peroxidase n=1 Tax=Wenyingzhuangia sp. 2_MG-2023 TaxID=3062639 RepID=UPI0026E3F78E|nr:glutathione peroxidase [Wenyingzhuangia sp. 2_MG-2023]MDO6739131.1 glutathione peroxidase [Wenyingzhuangia sp. 2_MG-2023]MDO6803576.1 glutathione peroxidase [Wenyingzhuangia sp. 1_MG-2023]
MKLLYIILPILLFAYYIFREQKVKITNTKTSIYDFIVKDLQGNDFNFSTLKGKKIMIVNTASKCGLTPQYEQLQEIYEAYNNSNNFTIVGFPANNFLYQEPGDSEDIQEFCQLNYGVTFPMMEKIDVKGKNQAEIYQFLTRKKFNGVQDSKVTWNFQKFLIGRDGKLEKVISPKIKPNDPSIVNWITK